MSRTDLRAVRVPGPVPGPVLGAALVFGVLAALVKGHDGGVRDTIGNLCTPWLLVALAAGLHTRSLPRPPPR